MTNNKQQTAVEWLCKELESYGDPQFCEIEWKQLDLLLEQAKEMEKQQIKDALRFPITLLDMSSEEYYKETFGGKDE